MSSIKAIETAFRESLLIGPGAISQILPQVKQHWQPGWTEILLQAYFGNTDQEVANELLDILRQFEGSANANAIATHLDWSQNPQALAILLSACWESHMDFSQVVGTIAQKAIHSTYAVGIEMMTLIENHLGNLSMEERNQLAETLKPGIESLSGDTRPLWEAISEMVRAY